MMSSRVKIIICLMIWPSLAYPFFCKSLLKAVSKDLKNGKNLLSTKVIAETDEVSNWLLKYSSYTPYEVDKKKILNGSNVIIGIPIKDSENSKKYKLIMRYKALTPDDEKFLLLKEVYLMDTSGKKIQLTEELQKKLIESSKSSQPNEIISFNIFDSQERIITRVSERSLDKFSSFMKQFLSLPGRNSQIRDIRKLRSIGGHLDRRAMWLKYYLINKVNFVHNRTGKELGNIPIAIALVYITSTSLTNSLSGSNASTLIKEDDEDEDEIEVEEVLTSQVIDPETGKTFNVLLRNSDSEYYLEPQDYEFFKDKKVIDLQFKGSEQLFTFLVMVDRGKYKLIFK